MLAIHTNQQTFGSRLDSQLGSLLVSAPLGADFFSNSTLWFHYELHFLKGKYFAEVDIKGKNV